MDELPKEVVEEIERLHLSLLAHGYNAKDTLTRFARFAIAQSQAQQSWLNVNRRCSCGFPEVSCSRTQTDCAAWKP